jgi:DNA-binding transcriptional MerR regulator
LNDDDNNEVGSQTYRIGAVSRLTGIPADTLRVWERRYEVVTPTRTPSGTRLYSAPDVARLGLIKQLVDRGDAISSVAPLSLEQLRERNRGAVLPLEAREPERPCRVVVLGPTLGRRLSGEPGGVAGLDLVGSFTEADRFIEEAAGLSPDVAVLEYPTVHAEQVREILDLVSRSGAPRGLLVYNFAAAATVERLEARRIVPRRAPVDMRELRRWCLIAHAGARLQPPADREMGIDLSRPPPPRRFDDAALARIAEASTTVRCECPHHLVDLIGSLAAFEVYSEECEIRNLEDAALHAFLRAATAQARVLLETALVRVIEAEGVGVDLPGAPT